LVVLSLILLLFTQRYLTTGTIVVTTNNPSNNIEILKASNKVQVAQARGYLRARLATGQYIAQVNNRLASNKQLVTIESHKTNTFNINLQALLAPEAVLPYGATSVITDASSIYYVNLQNHSLYTLSSAGVPMVVSTTSFDHIVWENTHYGIGIDYSQSTLYEIRNGSVTPLPLSFASTQIVFDLAPNGTLAASDGKTVYLRLPSSNTFTKIFTADSDENIQSLVVSNNYILVMQASNQQASDRDEGNFRLLDLSGRTGAAAQLSAYSLKWSPDGTKIALTNDSSTTIYNTHLKQIAELPAPNVTGLSWYDNNTLLYAANNILTKFDLTSSTSSQLSIYTANNQILGIYPDKTDSKIYLLDTTGSGDTNYQLEQIDLTQQAQNIPDYEYTLGIFFPAFVSPCNFSYTNFLKPVILTNSGANQNQCVQAAQNTLAADGLPVNEFNIEPALPSN